MITPATDALGGGINRQAGSEAEMRRSIGAVVVVLLVLGGWVNTQSQSPSLEGAWRVSEVVVTGANAATNKTPQPALYLFTKKHYSILAVQGTEARKPFATATDPDKLTDAEKMARFEAWNRFTANSGTYEVKGSTLTTTPLVAKNPSAMQGRGQAREFKLAGSTLTLISKSAEGQPASETRTTLTRVE
jgi:hypothetical protein